MVRLLFSVRYTILSSLLIIHTHPPTDAPLIQERQTALSMVCPSTPTVSARATLSLRLLQPEHECYLAYDAQSPISRYVNGPQ
jgi:hypothetical protein